MTAREAAEQRGAQMYLPWPGDPTGQTPQLFYRWTPTRRNDGVTHIGLEYLSFCDLWYGSSISTKEGQLAFARDRLTPIPGAQQIEPE